MPPLPAAQVQKPISWPDASRLDQEIDLRDGVDVVLDDVAIGAQIQGVEQLPPPLPGEVVFEIGDRSERPRPARRGPRWARWYAFVHRVREFWCDAEVPPGRI